MLGRQNYVAFCDGDMKLVTKYLTRTQLQELTERGLKLTLCTLKMKCTIKLGYNELHGIIVKICSLKS